MNKIKGQYQLPIFKNPFILMYFCIPGMHFALSLKKHPSVLIIGNVRCVDIIAN